MGEAPKNVAERRCGLRRGPWHLETRIRAGAPSSVAYIEAAATGDLHRRAQRGHRASGGGS